MARGLHLPGGALVVADQRTREPLILARPKRSIEFALALTAVFGSRNVVKRFAPWRRMSPALKDRVVMSCTGQTTLVDGWQSGT